MRVVMGMSIFWMLYGIAGLLGFQNIPAKFKGHSWTEEYTRKQGLTWLLLGIPEFLLTVIITNFFPALIAPNPITQIAIVVLGMPSLIYSILLDRKYRALLKKAQETIAT